MNQFLNLKNKDIILWMNFLFYRNLIQKWKNVLSIWIFNGRDLATTIINDMISFQNLRPRLLLFLHLGDFKSAFFVLHVIFEFCEIERCIILTKQFEIEMKPINIQNINKNLIILSCCVSILGLWLHLIRKIGSLKRRKKKLMGNEWMIVCNTKINQF